MIIAKFRLYMECKRQYYIVNVHDTYLSMRNHCNWVKISKDCRGLSSPEKHYKVYLNGRIRITPCVGQINLIKTHVNAEIAAHEIFHAVVNYTIRRKINIYTKGDGQFCSDEHERAAYIMGYMMRQFNHHAHRLKIWTK